MTFLAVLCGQSPAQQAGQPEPPTLDLILHRLQDNLDRSKTGLPSFYCDEHLVSKKHPDRNKENTVADSIFRLKRLTSPATALEESRDAQRINGFPATSTAVNGPTMLRGAFSGGFALVSLSQQACMHYTLLPINPKRPREPYIIEFVSVSGNERSNDCLFQEDVSGRVRIDPATTQVRQIEIHSPSHTITPARTAYGKLAPPVVGVWDLSIIYEPVLIGGRSFWLPSRITGDMTSELDEKLNQTRWSYKASYRNYHKLEVTSHIVPVDGESAPVSRQ